LIKIRASGKKLDKQLANKIKKKLKYNELAFKITLYELNHCKPPEMLLKEAEELARQIDMPEAEL